MPLAGVLAPSRMSQWSIVLLSLPFAPVVVLKTTVPLVALVFTPRSVSVAEGVAAGLIDEAHRHAAGAGVRDGQAACRRSPLPPGRPSMVTNCAPFKSTVAAVVFALEMESAVAPLAGRMVSVFTALAPLSAGMVSGKVSTRARRRWPATPARAPRPARACISAMAAVMRSSRRWGRRSWCRRAPPPTKPIPKGRLMKAGRCLCFTVAISWELERRCYGSSASRKAHSCAATEA